jgi:hypothetical protein
MLRRLIVPALLAATLVAAAGVSLADTRTQPDPVPVGVPGDKVTKGFSSSLAVFVHAPVGWERGCCYDSTSGEWIGARYRPSKNPNIENRAAILWGVHFVRGTNLAAAARAGDDVKFPESAAAARTVPHIVGGRKAGTLKAFATMNSEASPSARREGVLAIGISRKVIAVVTFFSSDPAADDTGAAGTITIDGKPASQWNQDQINAAIGSVYVEGNLPPRTVKAKGAHGRVTGTVKDAFGHPLSEAKLTLQRASGKHWKKAAGAFTGAKGTFAFKRVRAGRYRVMTSVGGTVVTSRPLNAR